MNNKLIIDNDLKVRITTILQWETYGGMMEGYPTERFNRRMLIAAVAKAKQFCNLEEVFLVEPEQKPFHIDGLHGEDKPFALPRVICIAHLASSDTFRDKQKDSSALGLVWLQDDYAFPIDEEVMKKIKAIPYRQICREHDF